MLGETPTEHYRGIWYDSGDYFRSPVVDWLRDYHVYTKITESWELRRAVIAIVTDSIMSLWNFEDSMPWIAYRTLSEEAIIAKVAYKVWLMSDQEVQWFWHRAKPCWIHQEMYINIHGERVPFDWEPKNDARLARIIWVFTWLKPKFEKKYGFGERRTSIIL